MARRGRKLEAVQTLTSQDLDVQWLGRLSYQIAWERQRDLHAARVARQVGDTVLLVEHESVYTAGKRTLQEERPPAGVPVIDVDRGGKITWHGPGQLVGYPVVALPDRTDVVGHVRRLESALIEVCDALGVAARRVAGRSGVWTRDGQRKLAAIGIRVAQGVTMHGFALNCDPDLSAFTAIVPCGIRDAGVTSLTVEAGHQIGIQAARPFVEAAVRSALPIADPCPR